MAETPIVNFRLALEDIATMDALVAEARKDAPAELAIAVSRTSVVRAWLARERARLAVDDTGPHVVLDCGITNGGATGTEGR